MEGIRGSNRGKALQETPKSFLRDFVSLWGRVRYRRGHCAAVGNEAERAGTGTEAEACHGGKRFRVPPGADDRLLQPSQCCFDHDELLSWPRGVAWEVQGASGEGEGCVWWCCAGFSRPVEICRVALLVRRCTHSAVQSMELSTGACGGARLLQQGGMVALLGQKGYHPSWDPSARLNDKAVSYTHLTLPTKA